MKSRSTLTLNSTLSLMALFAVGIVVRLDGALAWSLRRPDWSRGPFLKRREKSCNSVHAAGCALAITFASLTTVGGFPEPVMAEPITSTLSISESDNQKDTSLQPIETPSYSLTLPSNWKIITSAKRNGADDQQTGVLLSVLDLHGGATVTVVRERACPAQEYFNQPTRCDLPLPANGGLQFHNDGDNSLAATAPTTQSMVRKLLIRRDDRDNAVLGAAPSTLESWTRRDGLHADLVSSTSIPTGATTKNAIGQTVEDMLVRVAKAQVGIQQEERSGGQATAPNLLLSVWVSAPLDEWQKPVSGIRLQQVVDSIRIN